MGHLMTQVPAQTVHNMMTSLAQDVMQDVRQSESIEAAGPQEIVVRDIIPSEDLTSGDDNGWATGGDNEWRQDYSAAASPDAWNEAYEIDSTGAADDKIIAFLGVQFAAGDPIERELRFLRGTGGTGGVKGWFNLEEVENDSEGTGIFAQPIKFGATENGSIAAWIEDAVDDNRMRLLGVVGTTTGEVVSFPSNPQIAPPTGGGR